MGFRHVVGDSLHDIPIEIGPVSSGEHIQVNLGVCWVKDKACVVFKLKVSHDVESGQEMSKSRVREVGQEEGNLGGDVNAAKVHYPAHHSNYMGVKGWVGQVKGV
jgi:hypothetical protein